MSALSKAALKAAFEALPTPITRAALETLFDNTIDSYQDTLPQLTTAEINALTPTLNQLVYNTDTNYMMQYNGTIWVALVAMLIGNTATINASTPKAGQLFYNTTTNTLSFGDGVTHVGVQTDECTCVQRVKVSLSSAQILNSNTSPVELIPAPGAGKYIDVISLNYDKKFVSSQYTTNLDGQIFIGTALIGVCTLGYTEDVFAKDEIILFQRAKSEIVNQSIYLKTDIGNPAAGDGTIDIWITYTVITL